MRKKEQTPRVEHGQKSTSARSHCNSEGGDDSNQHGSETHREKSKVADHMAVVTAHWWMKKVLRQNR